MAPSYNFKFRMWAVKVEGDGWLIGRVWQLSQHTLRLLKIASRLWRPLRALTLDPKRDYPPLNGRRPIHNVLGQASGMS